MRRFLSMIALLVAACSGDAVHATVPEVRFFYQEGITTGDIEFRILEYITESVPKKFQKRLFEEIKTFPHSEKLLVLGVANVESGGWRYMESIRPNTNGTLDKGPMGLNTVNIANPLFRKLYFPENYASMDPDVLYLVACIRFLDYLNEKYDTLDDVLKAYNAGEKRLKANEIPEKTLKYVRLVKWKRWKAYLNVAENLRPFDHYIGEPMNSDIFDIIGQVSVDDGWNHFMMSTSKNRYFDNRKTVVKVVLSWIRIRHWMDGNDAIQEESGVDTVVTIYNTIV